MRCTTGYEDPACPVSVGLIVGTAAKRSRSAGHSAGTAHYISLSGKWLEAGRRASLLPHGPAERLWWVAAPSPNQKPSWWAHGSGSANGGRRAAVAWCRQSSLFALWAFGRCDASPDGQIAS